MMSLGLVYEGVAFCMLPWRCRRGPCWLVSYSCSCGVWVSSASNAARAWERATASSAAVGVCVSGASHARAVLYLVKSAFRFGTAVGILDRIHPMLPGPNPCDTAWGSYNPGRSLS